ncbi:restriction endonuclease subunit S [Flavobacteriaceae bacterium]|nr:restriction endonuclease subunit S [Flavobacteriaceae bacterium]
MNVRTENKVVPKLRFGEFEDDWNNHLLDDIATFLKGKGISKSELDDDGKTECIRYGELYVYYNELIDEVKSKTNLKNIVLSKANDVIIPASGETQLDIATASCVLRSGIALGGDLNIIRTDNNGVFLSYYLNSKKKFEIARLSQGSSVVHLYASQLKTLKLNLPSLTEQQKIASFLSALDKKLQQLTKKKELLEEYKKGIMQIIFSQELRFKDDSGNNYPDWEEKRLNDVFNSKRGSGLSGKNIVSDGKNKCILYGALYTKYDEVIDEVLESTNEEGKVESQIGDILVPASTTTTGIDLANFTALNQEGVLLGGDISILRFIKKGYNVYWAYYLTHYKKNQVARYAQGSTIVHIYFSHFGKIQIKEPSFEEQKKIANFLSSIDSKIELVSTQIENTKAFKKGLLQQMFV